MSEEGDGLVGSALTEGENARKEAEEEFFEVD